MNETKVAILTVSDRCSRNQAEDTSGDNLASLIDKGIIPSAKVLIRKCVPDEKEDIQSTLENWCDQEQVNLILTTGGTGFSPRDVTPEVVANVIEKQATGIVTKMMLESLNVTPLAALSRPVAGIRKTTLIVTLPGSKKASEECLRFIASVIPHAIDLLLDRKSAVSTIHRRLNPLGDNTHHSLHHHHHNHHRHNNASQHQHKCHHHHHSPHGEQSQADVTKVSRRPRKSPYPMISVKEALDIILDNAERNNVIQLPLEEALHYVLAEDIQSQYPLPPFPASIKDGYAVVAADGPGLRNVLGDSTAGALPDASTVTSGFCVRINTGAPVPQGADAVVQVEDTELTKESEDGCKELEIKILSTPKVGQDIRPIGCDISEGETILTAGSNLQAPELGLIASVGRSLVSVYKKSTVALLSTGNELQTPGTALKVGHIYDSNKTVLLTYLKHHNIPTFNAGIATDDTGSLLKAIRHAFHNADILVTTGGVSMGERDILRPVLISDFGATIHFAQVFMKPGKPTTFATCSFEGRKKMILGLPGNPVSATVTSFLYLVPLSMKLAGHKCYKQTAIPVKLSSDIHLDQRPEYHRVSLRWNPGETVPEAASTGHQLSSRLLSYNSADALLRLPASSPDKREMHKGEIVSAFLLGLPYH